MKLDYNVGKRDKTIRIGVGAVLTVVGLLISKSFLLTLIGVILLATGFLSFCGIYKLLGFSTAESSEATNATQDLSQRVEDSVEDFKEEAAEIIDDVKEEAEELSKDVKDKLK